MFFVCLKNDKIKGVEELTPKAFENFLSRTLEENLPATGPIKYVMYVRKSTDEKNNQTKSIPEQIAECKEYFKRLGLNYVDIITEKKSAKESGKRKEFERMLKAIQAKVYDGILCWHPDRLARNMKEAGEIIDLIDKNKIKDLKCVSFTFNNDPSGKLLLGITFAMSKEYSDKLSENVKRGNRFSLKEGVYVNKTKDGYYKDKDGRLRPDGEYFDLMRKAIEMRLQGETLDHIALFIKENKEKYRLKSKSKRKLKLYTKQKVSELLQDSVYTGIFLYGKQVVNLLDIYDFKPIVSPDEYMQINKGIKGKNLHKVFVALKKEGVKANLMRGRVFCGECYQSMSSGITLHSKTKRNYFYYRCETEGCPRKNKSERPLVILEYVCDLIKNNFKYTTETWDHYKKETTRVYNEGIEHLTIRLADLKRQKQEAEKKAERIRFRLYDKNENFSKEMRTDISNDYQKELDTIGNLNAQIEETSNLKGEKLTLMSENEFLELMQKLPEFIMQNQNIEILDQILRKMFLNFTVLRKKVIKSTLNQPFDTLFGTKVPISAGERT